MKYEVPGSAGYNINQFNENLLEPYKMTDKELVTKIKESYITKGNDFGKVCLALIKEAGYRPRPAIVSPPPSLLNNKD